METEAGLRLQYLQERILNSGFLPGENGIDKILRYETAIERQMYRAINELERLQQRKQGEVLNLFLFLFLAAIVRPPGPGHAA